MEDRGRAEHRNCCMVNTGTMVKYPSTLQYLILYTVLACAPPRLRIPASQCLATRHSRSAEGVFHPWKAARGAALRGIASCAVSLHSVPRRCSQLAVWTSSSEMLAVSALALVAWTPTTTPAAWRRSSACALRRSRSPICAADPRDVDLLQSYLLRAAIQTQLHYHLEFKNEVASRWLESFLGHEHLGVKAVGGPTFRGLDDGLVDRQRHAARHSEHLPGQKAGSPRITTQHS